ncbi:MAG: MarR family transcriptional regulator [Acidimicrobiales bacterium]
MDVATVLHGLISTGVRRGLRGMSLTSLSTLATLDRTGSRRITDLAVIEGVTQPSMTVLVRSLERSGLVERRGDPSDKRVALIAMTANGAELLRVRRQAGAEAFKQLIEKLPADEVAMLIAALPALEHLRSFDNEQREPVIESSDELFDGAASVRPEPDV